MDSEQMKSKSDSFALMSPQDRALALQGESSIFLNVAKFEQMQRAAAMMSKTDFIPQRFVNNVGNCFIAIDLAERMRMHPLMLMQTMYIVHGTPGFEGKFMSALVNNSGRYTDPLEYEWKGKQGTPEWGCRAFAKRKSTDKIVAGPWVDWKMVTAEGWHKPKGTQTSKWTTMPEVMFMYRAASFFVKTNDSDLMMGMQTVEELHEMDVEMIRGPGGVFTDGSKAEKRPDLYNITQKSKGVNKDAKEPLGNENPKQDTEALQQPEQQADQGTETVQEEDGDGPAEDPKDQVNSDDNSVPDEVKVSTEWNHMFWHKAKAPGMKHQADTHKDTFIDQPLALREDFRKKWERLDGLSELRFPFSDVGVWIGYKPEPNETVDETEDNHTEESSDVETALMERFNEIWLSGHETAKFQASVNMSIPTNKRPEADEIGTWLTYYDACLKKVEQAEQNGGQTPFDDDERF